MEKKTISEDVADSMVDALVSTGECATKADAYAMLQKTGVITKPYYTISTHTVAQLLKFKGTTDAIVDLKKKVSKLSLLMDRVFIKGDTGTGKELIANALHGNRKGRFIAINVTALPAELVESELFGHVKGAFTGATSNKQGLIAEANNGTLFLDELSDMPQIIQAKLLRVLQEKRFRKVGGNDEQLFTGRIICASHKDPESYLRRDLYWRLCEHVLYIPPLKDRMEDVEELVLSYARNFKIKYSPKLLDYVLDNKTTNFDGNVRELQTLIKRYRLDNMKEQVKD